MKRVFRASLACAAGALLLTAGGCHYDYGYYSVDYSYGYDCSPSYHSTFGYDYGCSTRYHAPCDGLRFRTGYSYGYGGHGCD